MLLSTSQSCSSQLEPNRTSTLRYPVPCSKQTSITTQWLKENFVENGFTSVARSIMFEVQGNLFNFYVRLYASSTLYEDNSVAIDAF